MSPLLVLRVCVHSPCLRGGRRGKVVLLISLTEPIIITIKRRYGLGLLCLSACTTRTDCLCLRLMSLCLEWQYMGLIVYISYDAGHVYGVGHPYGQKVGEEGPASRRKPKKITRERQMHNKERIKTPRHLMRFVDLIFLHLSW
jgi:hypothetical protein